MDKYWLAIKKQNSEELVGILRDLPELVHSSLNCNPWRVEPDDTYTYETKGVHVCSLSGREQLLEILLRHKPNLDAITFEENKGLTTPLVLSAWEGSSASCQMLLDAGANPNTWASAESPLYTAAEHHAWDKVDMLVDYGAKHDIFTACICGRLEIVEAEIKAYRPLLAKTSIKRNRTPLEEAMEHQQGHIVKLIKDLIRS